ncbi:hypothetical protein ACO0M4_36020 [Streptomyces sp. RGM 3693]|uniref:hypothetical protein n=1 Tax=Streptomyces sp. RGM 3693 TaxID=3413284 RepID=UPI003D2B46FB
MEPEVRNVQHVIDTSFRHLRLALDDLNLCVPELAIGGNGVRLGTVGPHTAERPAQILKEAR